MKIKWPFSRNKAAAPQKRRTVSHLGRLRRTMATLDPRFRDCSTDVLVSAIDKLIGASTHTDKPPGRAFVVEGDGQVIAKGADFPDEGLSVLMVDGSISVELGGMDQVRQNIGNGARVLWYLPPSVDEIAENPSLAAVAAPSPAAEGQQQVTHSWEARLDASIKSYVSINGKTPTKKAVAAMMDVEPKDIDKILKTVSNGQTFGWLDLVSQYEQQAAKIH